MSNFSIKNDGSFMEQFLKLQQSGGADCTDSAAPTSAAATAPSDSTATSEGATTAEGDPSAAAAGEQQQMLGPDGQPLTAEQMAAMWYDPQTYQQYYQQYYAAYGYGYPGYSGYPGAAAGGGYPGADARSSGPGPARPTNDSGRTMPSRSVWLGNLPPDVSEAEIRAKFAHYGLIENVKMLSQKNCAFVNFADLDAAIAAHDNSNGVTIRGQEIRIGWGKPDTNEGSSAGRSDQRDNIAPSRNLWVGNLSPEVGEDILRQEFQVFGAIDRVRALPHKSCAFITFVSLDSAMAARNHLQGKVLGDRPIRVNYGRDGERDIERRQERERGDRSGLGYEGGGGGGGGAPWHQDRSPPPATPPAPPPKFTPPPPNPEEQKVIDKMAEYVARNGVQFEAMLKEKEKNNPKLQFLFLGDSRYEYYTWKLYCLRHDIPSDGSVIPTAPAHPPAPSHAPSSGGIERGEFDQLIANLSGTREAITSGREWILSHARSINDIVDRVLAATQSATDPEKKLHIIYLINDTLLHSMKSRDDPTVLDEVCASFLPKLVHILLAGLEGQDEERADKILKILNYWGKRSVYDTSVIDRMERQLQRLEPIPPLPSSSSAARSSVSSSLPPWQQPPSYGSSPSGGSSAPPPWQQHPPSSSASSYYGGGDADRKRGRDSPDNGHGHDSYGHDSSKYRRSSDWDSRGSDHRSSSSGGYRY